MIVSIWEFVLQLKLQKSHTLKIVISNHCKYQTDQNSVYYKNKTL